MIREGAARRASFRMGALIVLTACFGLSAILRAGDVVADLPVAGDDGFGNPIPQRATAASNSQSASAGQRVEVGPEVLLEELRRQREELAVREAEVIARESMLSGIGAQMQRRLDEMRVARQELANTAELVRDAAGKDVRHLAQMYQQMKPKQAAQIFNEMNPSFAAGFIGEMRPEASAQIMQNMDAGKAYAVSLLLAGRNLKDARDGDIAEPTPAAR